MPLILSLRRHAADAAALYFTMMPLDFFFIYAAIVAR